MKNVLICWACSLAVFCSYSFLQGQEHKTSLQLMQLQFYGHVYRHLFLLDGLLQLQFHGHVYRAPFPSGWNCGGLDFFIFNLIF